MEIAPKTDELVNYLIDNAHILPVREFKILEIRCLLDRQLIKGDNLSVLNYITICPCANMFGLLRLGFPTYPNGNAWVLYYMTDSADLDVLDFYLSVYRALGGDMAHVNKDGYTLLEYAQKYLSRDIMLVISRHVSEIPVDRTLLYLGLYDDLDILFRYDPNEVTKSTVLGGVDLHMLQDYYALRGCPNLQEMPWYSCNILEKPLPETTKVYSAASPGTYDQVMEQVISKL